jgi:single-stranded DNA-specific DHH superfamily exonuclease
MQEAETKRFEYSRQILDAFNEAVKHVQDMGSVRYLNICCSDVTGAIASTIIRYVMPDKPIIVMNTEDGTVKVSARGTSDLINKGLDLAAAVRESALKVKGSGGGHKIASGANIPLGYEKEFLASVDEIIGRQLHGQV